jgi:hypothetical protein
MVAEPTCGAMHCGPYDHRINAINFGRTSILSGNKVDPPISAPVNVRGVPIAIPGFADAGCQRTAGVFPSVLPSFGR